MHYRVWPALVTFVCSAMPVLAMPIGVQIGDVTEVITEPTWNRELMVFSDGYAMAYNWGSHDSSSMQGGLSVRVSKHSDVTVETSITCSVTPAQNGTWTLALGEGTWEASVWGEMSMLAAGSVTLLRDGVAIFPSMGGGGTTMGIVGPEAPAFDAGHIWVAGTYSGDLIAGSNYELTLRAYTNLIGSGFAEGGAGGSYAFSVDYSVESGSQYSTAMVPEPCSLAVVVTGCGLVCIRRRRSAT